MSESENSPYRDWLDKNMIVTDDRCAIACVTHGELMRWEFPDQHPGMEKMEIRVILHMAAEHGEDYDRIKPAD